MLSKFIFILCVCCAFQLQATVVEVRTSLGNIQINLFDDVTPDNVENFLGYVNAGAYQNNLVHRSVPGFIVQMGGFEYANSFPPEAISTGAGITNEPELSNVRGTIAMAKLSGDPDSATSQFFINLSDNSANLDVQNSGFTVIGQVIGDGMAIADAVAALPRFNYGGAFSDLPLRDFSVTDATNGVEPNDDNLVVISDIVVIDAASVTNPQIVPVENTRLNTSTPAPTPSASSGGSSGGALSIWCLLLVGVITLRRLHSHYLVTNQKPRRLLTLFKH